VNWIRLFVSPYGAIGRRTFFHGLLVVVFVNLSLTISGMMISHQPHVWPMLATLWPTICITSKRLHTFDRSGWLQTPQRATLVGVLLAPMVPSTWWSSHAWPLAALWLLAIAAVIADGLLFLYLALHPRSPLDAIGEVFG
jgi:uncharacterized membrane protein YhaH (DUF805 family)